MEFLSIASGSSGNSIFVGSDRTKLLVDVGISAKRIISGLSELDLKPEDLAGILITHEHIDHVKGLGVFARKYHLPMYATLRTVQAVKAMSNLGEYDTTLFRTIRPDERFSIGDIDVEASQIWHDASDPVCYCFYCGEQKISIATDLGDYNPYLLAKLADSDFMLIEANHDVRMLEVGPYPYPLKRRILSDHGHLSNERSGAFIRELLHSHVKGIALGHLSKENNYPELAYETVRQALKDNSYGAEAEDLHLTVASRSVPSAHCIF